MSINNLTQEQKKDIEDFAAVYFSHEQICIALELDLDEFQSDYDNEGEIYRIVQKGKLQRLYKQRKMIFELAENGSTPAQQMAMKIIEAQSLEELKL
ncbi:hypothetical protein V9L05_01355 [Bernardetia sp. Wsw4-3y2]|uniref:hypothetical protein n=1 Tax=Bernardetia sp. Wsw4-3y2 TaxID=3127471 RepID=UPI0030D3AFEB